GCRAERLARRRARDDGKSDRLQARGRRRRAHVLRAARRRETQTGLNALSPFLPKSLMGEFAIGQGVPRFEDPRLVQGRGRYIDDVVYPGMAFGVLLRSPHGHAKINSIDVTAAKAAPGVLAVITAADWKNAGLGELPGHGGLKRRDGSPMFKPPYPVLAEDRVRWVGDPIAFVVAETTAQAQDAAELIEIDYEALPAVVSTAEASKPDAAKVWDGCAD